VGSRRNARRCDAPEIDADGAPDDRLGLWLVSKRVNRTGNVRRDRGYFGEMKSQMVGFGEPEIEID